MSVLMRGVQMPKNCEECNFKGECRNYWAKIREAYTRPSWCPLVEVAEQTEPSICDTCKHRHDVWYSPNCDACSEDNSQYEPIEQTEPKPCDTCKFYDGENCYEPSTDCSWK